MDGASQPRYLYGSAPAWASCRRGPSPHSKEAPVVARRVPDEDATLSEFVDAGDDEPATEDAADDASDESTADRERASAESDEPGATADAVAEGPDEPDVGPDSNAEGSDDADAEPDVGAAESAKPPANAAGPEAGGDGATATWSPEGAACERCGEAVQRRWRDGSETVCADCKEW